MYYVLLSIARPFKTTKVYRDSSPTANSSAVTMTNTMEAATGYIGNHTFSANGQLEIVNFQVWNDQASYDAWATAYSDMISAYNTDRDEYNATNNIQSVESKFTDVAVLF